MRRMPRVGDVLFGSYGYDEFLDEVYYTVIRIVEVYDLDEPLKWSARFFVVASDNFQGEIRLYDDDDHIVILNND